MQKNLWMSLLTVSLLAGCQVAPNKTPITTPSSGAPVVPEATTCIMDVQACPDGSYVSRDPAKNCAFRTCP
jgi:hypothetical protein